MQNYGRNMKIKKSPVKEDVTVGSGQIAGIGIENPDIPKQAEPGIKKKKVLSFKMFTRK